MTVKVTSQLLAESDCRFGGEILSSQRTDEAYNRQSDKNHSHFKNVGLVRVFDACVYYRRHYQRNKQFKARFKHFEQRRKDAFFNIMPQILYKIFHIVSLFMLIILFPYFFASGIEIAVLFLQPPRCIRVNRRDTSRPLCA